MDTARAEIKRLHNVCREKDEGLMTLIQAVEGFLQGPLSAASITDLEQAVTRAKDYVPIYRRGEGNHGTVSS